MILYFALTGHFNNLGFGYTTRTTRKALKKNKREDLIFFKITETEFGELKQSLLYERFENRG